MPNQPELSQASTATVTETEIAPLGSGVGCCGSGTIMYRHAVYLLLPSIQTRNRA